VVGGGVLLWGWGVLGGGGWVGGWVGFVLGGFSVWLVWGGGVGDFGGGFWG